MMGVVLVSDDLVKRLRDLRLEALERLQREQRDRIEQLERENARLRDEADRQADANAKDAERYRWLMDHDEFLAKAADHLNDEGNYDVWRTDIEQEIDAAIDAARKGAKK